MKKIIIDLEGADNGAGELFRGVLLAAKKYPDLHFVLSCTDPDSMKKELSEKNAALTETQITFLPADDMIRNDEPAMSIFKGRDSSSMAVALDVLKNDEDAAGLLCAGNTGALMVGSIFRLGLVDGYRQPALSTMLPNTKGGMTTLVDCGANVNIEAGDLKKFAVLGSEFVSRMFQIEKPAVALLNVGREEGKGNPLYVEAYGLLKELGEQGIINFIGNAEGYDIITGYADVIVCDGYAGNVVLKLTESVGKCALSLVEAKQGNEEIAEKLKELFVFNERGGATFLGTKKPVIKMHGCAGAETVVSCVEQLLRLTV